MNSEQRKPRLTKKRLAALDAALTVDEVLFERYKRMMEAVHQEMDKVYKAKHTVEVFEERPSGLLVCLQIQRVEVTPKGTRVIVRATEQRGER